MNEEEGLVHQALTPLHPVLADLYARGVELVGEPGRPGQVHLIAHIGRELSNSFLRLIASELPSSQPLVSASVTAELTSSREGMRLEIGRALGLSPQHPTVRAWFRIHSAFHARAHVPVDGRPRDSAETVDAYRVLTKLLWSRLAPYFSTDDELVALLSRPPRTSDIETLHALFLRPQLRNRFFALCRSPEWVEFLDGAEFFSHVPEADGVQGATVPWPEGTALMNVAATAPAIIVRIILERIPSDNRNPAVADRVLRAIELLPSEFLPSVLGLLTNILRHGHSRYGGPAALAVAAKLAAAGDLRAIDLIAAMLRLRPLEAVDRSKLHRIISPPTYSLLETVDDYYVGRVLLEVVPVVAEQHPIPLARCLVDRLARAECLIGRAGYDDANFSHHWLSRWGQPARGRDDLRKDLARAVDVVAQNALAGNPGSFEDFDALLQDRPSDLMRRLRLRFMIGAGPGGAAEQIDAVIASDWIVDPEFGAREVAELLRRHFATASRPAKATFVTRIEVGPEEDVIRSYCERHGLDATDQQARAEGIKVWQEKRLRWFQENLPDELHPLAARIGFTPQLPDQQQQDLDEVGHWSSGAVWAGDRSPKSVDDLRGLSSADIVDFLVSWNPTEVERFNDINRRGLADRLRQLLAENIGGYRELPSHLASREGIDPAYLSAALTACGAIAKEAPGESFPWQEVLMLAQTAILAQPSGAPEDRARLWARREALRLLVDSNKSSTFPPGRAGELVSLVDHAVTTVPAWAHLEEAEFTSFESIGLAALNHDAGLVVDLVVAVTRFLAESEGHDITDAGSRVASWLNSVLEWNGTVGAAARWQLGHHLPAIIHYANTWIQANEHELLDQGMSDPLRAPTWGAYLHSYGVYDNVFRRLEPWYRLHAGQIHALHESEAGTENQRDDQRLSRHLVEHVGMGLLRGLIAFDGDQDDVLRQVLVQSSGADRAHFAWQVMHALDNADGPLQEGFTDRVIQYWQWRLDAIDARQDPEDAKELDALGWFINIEQLAPESIIDLAVRTIEGNSTTFQVRGHVWEALPAFVALDPVRTVQMVEAMVSAILGGEYPYVHFDEVAPVLRLILDSGDQSARKRAILVINRLGEAGWSEFRRLLD